MCDKLNVAGLEFHLQRVHQVGPKPKSDQNNTSLICEFKSVALFIMTSSIGEYSTSKSLRVPSLRVTVLSSN